MVVVVAVGVVEEEEGNKIVEEEEEGNKIVEQEIVAVMKKLGYC